jgi:hypothetical protein
MIIYFSVDCDGPVLKYSGTLYSCRRYHIQAIFVASVRPLNYILKQDLQACFRISVPVKFCVILLLVNDQYMVTSVEHGGHNKHVTEGAVFNSIEGFCRINKDILPDDQICLRPLYSLRINIHKCTRKFVYSDY